MLANMLFLHLSISCYIDYQHGGEIRGRYRIHAIMNDWIYIIRFSIPGTGTYWLDVTGICH